MAQGYQWVFGLLVPTQHRFNPSQLPSGYMISSAEDMSHFLIAHLNEGRYASKNLLSASSTAAMQMPGTNRGGQGSYGFGWVISPKGGVPAVWHDGVNANFHTLLLMQPETRRGAVLLMNSFGIVPSLSAYQEIEEGVARLLAGLQPAPAEIRLGSLYFIIDALFALSLVIAVWPLAHIQRWYRRLFALQQAGRLALGRAFLRVGWEIGFALVFIITVRLVIITGLGAQSWYEVFTVFPDFVMWIWALTLIGLFTGFARLILIFKTRRAYLRGGGAIAEQTLSDSILRTAEK
jgi:hypothetical protein